MHRIRRAMAGLRMAPQPDHAHVEGFGELSDAPADLTEPDDEQCLAAELVLPAGEIADHATPYLLHLVVARLREAARQSEDQSHRVLGDRSVVDAPRAREADAASRQFFARELVGAGA